MNRQFFYKYVIYLFLVLTTVTSCSRYKQVPCPDFRRSRSYSGVNKDTPGNSKLYRRKSPDKLVTTRKKNKNGREGMENITDYRIIPVDNTTTHKYNTLNNEETSDSGSTGEIENISHPDIHKRKYISPDTVRFENNEVAGPGYNVKNELFSTIPSPKEITKITELTRLKKQDNDERIKEKQAGVNILLALSVITGLTGLFIAGIPLGILTLILGSITLRKIENDPELKGSGVAIACIIFGFIDFVGALIVLVSLV